MLTNKELWASDPSKIVELNDGQFGLLVRTGARIAEIQVPNEEQPRRIPIGRLQRLGPSQLLSEVVTLEILLRELINAGAEHTDMDALLEEYLPKFQTLVDQRVRQRMMYAESDP